MLGDKHKCFWAEIEPHPGRPFLSQWITGTLARGARPQTQWGDNKGRSPAAIPWRLTFSSDGGPQRVSVGWNWRGSIKATAGLVGHPQAGVPAVKAVLLSLASPRQTPLTKTQFSLCPSPRDSQSISSWAVAAFLHCPELQLQAPLSPWVGMHSQRVGAAPAFLALGLAQSHRCS